MLIAMVIIKWAGGFKRRIPKALPTFLRRVRSKKPGMIWMVRSVKLFSAHHLVNRSNNKKPKQLIRKITKQLPGQFLPLNCITFVHLPNPEKKMRWHLRENESGFDRFFPVQGRSYRLVALSSQCCQ